MNNELPEEDGPKKHQLLLIDDDNLVLETIELQLAHLPVTVQKARTCQEAYETLRTNAEIAVVVCDQLLPDGNGVEILEYMQNNYPAAVRILMTGAYDRKIALDAINRGHIYRFIDKPFSQEELESVVMQSIDRYNLRLENQNLQEKLALQNEELRQINLKLEGKIRNEQEKREGAEKQKMDWKEACQSMVTLVLEIMQRIDVNLFIHSQRVSRLARVIAREMKYDEDFLDQVELAALLHDIGLLGSPAFLKVNQRKLEEITAERDREHILEHPKVSASLVRFLPQKEIVEAIEHHHEYLNGSGYPDGLQGERISRMTCILSVADSYDEYGLEKGKEHSLSEIEMRSGELYDAEVVRTLQRLVTKPDFRISSERVVLVGELEAGMKLMSSIYTKTGMLLVKQGEVLNERLIDKIAQHDRANALTQTIFVEDSP